MNRWKMSIVAIPVIALSAAWLVSQPVRAMEGPAAGTDGAVDPALPPPPPPGGPLMRILDTDDSRDLSAEEIAAAPEVLQSLDKNGDGKLNAEDLRPPMPPVGEQAAPRRGAQGGPGPRPGIGPRPHGPDPLMFALDTNKDREVSAEEIAAAAESLQKLDANGDGTITFEEVLPPPPPMPVVKALDTDANGTISPEEIANAAASLKTLDVNGDGSLTRDELCPPRPEGPAPASRPAAKAQRAARPPMRR